ncbi:MAG: DUF5666 domain-containing protein [Betaproteobacteria bacterium]
MRQPCTPSTRLPRPWRALGALLLATGLVGACGGGGGDTGVGSGGTGSPLSFSQGPITGFGSIVVNGVHFDDAPASVMDDDGNALSNTAALRLGTVVDVQGGAIVDNATRASAIRVRVALHGPVSAAYDATTRRLAVLGQPLAVVATTALGGIAGGAAAIAAGSVVAVSALYDQASGVYVATRIDPVAAAGHYAIRGAVGAVDTVAHTFTIGASTFDYGSVALPASFGAGQLVRAVLATTPASSGHWVVTAFGQALAALEDGRRGGLRGVVDSATDATHFVVAGLPVDASGATVAPAGASIAVRSRVEVQGTVVGGVLVASAVRVDARDDDDEGGGGSDGGEVEIAGAILGAVDGVAHTFTMRGPTTVNYASATFSDGTASDLATGVLVEVRGSLSADGTQVIATRVRIRH